MVKSTFGSNDDFTTTKSRKRLAKSLSTLIIKNSLSFGKIDIRELQKKSLDFVLSEVISTALSNYVLQEVAGMELVGAQVLGEDNLFEGFHFAKRGDLKAILLAYANNNSLHLVPSELDRLINCVEEENNLSERANHESIDEECSPYHRTSLIRLFLEEKHDENSIDINSDNIKRVLSIARLCLMIYDIKTMSSQDYFYQIELSEQLKNRELNDEYHELNQLVFDSEGKYYIKDYKITYRHYDLLPDYVDGWTKSLVHDICNPSISSSKELLKQVVKFISNA
jgi:hypothetical protein